MKGNYYYRQYERERTITNAIAIVGRANAIDRAIKNVYVYQQQHKSRDSNACLSDGS